MCVILSITSNIDVSGEMIILYACFKSSLLISFLLSLPVPLFLAKMLAVDFKKFSKVRLAFKNSLSSSKYSKLLLMTSNKYCLASLL